MKAIGCAVLVVVTLSILSAGAIAAPPSKPAQSTPQQMSQLQKATAAVPIDWQSQWFAGWRRAAAYYPIVAAQTTTGHPACSGNLGIDVLVRNTILAVGNHKYGDAADFAGQFQDRTLCLTRDGARGVEFALSMFLHNAITLLPPDQAQLALYGTLNLGALIFDQLQYTRSSWWLMTTNIDANRIAALMQFYPRQELGLLMYDWHRGYLVQSRNPNAVDELLVATRSLRNFGYGTCDLLDMSTNGFRCPDTELARAGALPIEGQNAPGGAFGALPVALPDVGMACLLTSIQMSGPRGQLACLSKHAARPNEALMTPAELMKTGDMQPGVIDKLCARSDEDGEDDGGDDAGGKGGDDGGGDAGDKGSDDTGGKTDDTKVKEPTAWDKVVDAVGTVVSVVANAIVAAFDPTPPVVSELGQLASKEGAEAVEGGLTAMQSMRTQQTLLNDGDEASRQYEQGRESMHRPNGQKRVVDDDGSAPGGNLCGRGGSNAAQRARALYTCIGGGDPQFSEKGTDKLNTFNAGGADPRVSYVIPDETGGGMTGAPMLCGAQGGDLVRRTNDDKRCGVARCASGADCQCNPNRAQFAEPKQIIREEAAQPRCEEGACPQGTLPSAAGNQGGIITTTGGTGGSSGATISPIVGGPAPPPPRGGTSPLPPAPR